MKNPKVILLCGQKGGPGKSTTATNLAVAASQNGFKTLIVDCDKQSSALFWYNLRPEHLDKPEIVKIQGQDAAKAVKYAAAKDFEVVIIDTAGRDLPSMKTALSVADLTITPTAPTVPDIAATTKTIESIKEHGKPFFLLLNNAAPGLNVRRNTEALKLLEMLGPVSPAKLCRRNDYQDAFGLGLSVIEHNKTGKAAREINALWLHVQKTINLSNEEKAA